MKKLRLSIIQINVLRLLQTGEWELGLITKFPYYVKLEKGKLGRGGYSIGYIKPSTVHSLVSKDLLNEDFKTCMAHTTIYKLTELGKQLKLN